MDRTRKLLVAASGVVGMLAFAAPARAQELVTRMSVASNGAQGDRESPYSSPASISADGRYVAFDSVATTLVAGGAVTQSIYVHDRVTGATVCVSIDSAGNRANLPSSWPSISGDGRFVAFQSDATNLVPGDFNGVTDIFVHNRDPDGNGIFDEGNGITRRVSVSSSGMQADGIGSFMPSISGDGRSIAFSSYADNLVVGDNNGALDVFVRDRAAGTTRRMSVSSAGAEGDNSSGGQAISADGMTVAFASRASNLASNDLNNFVDIFVRDRSNNKTRLVSVDSAGNGGDDDSFGVPAISSDGSVVVFNSYADNLVPGDSNGHVDVFLHDEKSGGTERVSVDSSGLEADADSGSAAVSADGLIVAFWSGADNLVAGDTNFTSDVFVHDRSTAQVTIASANCAGGIGNGASLNPSLSADGVLLALGSDASNLIVGDTNGYRDVFVVDRAVIEPDASWNNYGSGFPGALGIPQLVASANPVFGTTFTIDIDNSVGFWTVGFIFMGFDEAAVPTHRGGTLLVSLADFLPLVIPSDGASLQTTLPRDPALCGLSIFLQTLEIDAGAQFGISFTPGLKLVFGH